MELSVVILAAGKGKRMASALPKVLHPIGGRPMLQHGLDCARSLDARRCCIVVGHGNERIRAAIHAPDAVWVEQAEQLGTGHAVAQALPTIPDQSLVLVLYGDVPLVRETSLRPLVHAAADGALAILTVELENPRGYGRVIRDATGSVRRIVEEKDALEEERSVRECNTGMLAATARSLRAWTARLGNDNSQAEFYLTDVIGMAVQEQVPVFAARVEDPAEAMGANDRVQLAALERAYQVRAVRSLMLGGATLLDPARVDVRGAVTTGRDCLIDVNVVFEGDVRVGEDVTIGSNCLIRSSWIHDGAVIHPNCILDGAIVGPDCQVGPFARLRPGAELLAGARVGNFVEVKQSVLREGAKANHLTYIGDADVGQAVNVGAGTITCNYDGANKHRTVIGAGAFIGSNSSLVAPVEIGERATIGAGSTITGSAPAEELTLTRVKQRTIRNWKRPEKKR